MAETQQQPRVTVYSTSTCPWCVKAKQYLSQQGVPYIEKNVERDRVAAIEMVRVSGQQGVPVITVGDQVVVGFNKARLEQLLAGRPAAAPSGQQTSAPQRRTLGAQVADAQDITLRSQGQAMPGAYVGGVRAGSPAEWGGIKRGDIITAVNGAPVRNAADLEKIVGATQPGSHLLITAMRNGDEREIETML